jgi:hypothetical protein
MASVTLLTNIETYRFGPNSTKSARVKVYPDKSKKSWALPANNKITSIQYTISY